MTLRADQVRDLMAMGLEIETLKKVFEIVERKSPSTIRQQRWRANRPSTITPTTTSTVTPTITPTVDVSPSPILTSLSSKPLKETQKEKKEAAGARSKKRGSCMWEDWQPSDRARAHLNQQGFSDDEIGHEGVRLRNWALANGKTSTNWDLNLYNWMDKPVGGVNGTHQPVQRPRDRKTVHDVNRELLAKVRRGESVALFPGDGDAGGDRFARLLPRLGKG